MYTIDRIEGGFAVCEDEERAMHNVPLKDLPFEAKEGLSFVLENGSYFIVENPRKQRIKGLMNKLWK